jgi:alcohol dehydrogenase
MPGTKAVIVISNGKSMRSNGYLSRTGEQLRLAGVSHVVFDKVEANPTKSTVMEGASFAKKNGCEFIVALGGGSCIDAAKAMAIMCTNGGDFWDYMSGGTGKGKSWEHKPLPVVAISTTAGTGSETDPWTVVTNQATHEKIGVGNANTFPVFSIIDPELMKTVPSTFTAYQGLDAMFHSVEGYVSKGANMFSDVLTLAAIQNIARNLSKAVKNGNDIDAREKVAFGNILSGIGESFGVAISQHSLEHAMSAYHNELPHGAGLLMISKAYFTFFINKHVCDERYIQMARAMGMENANKPMDFITMLEKLYEDCGVADLKMSDYGIKLDELRKLAENAMETMGALFENDGITLSIDDCVAIYKAAYK